ncbi:hypothetical protein [Brevundimonas sp.]|jgi:hypothetical protein|uniref:hypothetical protein n=1 Tax=Brevundimonas sp. TaxID=1871086 RepID=UPI0037BEBB11
MGGFGNLEHVYDSSEQVESLTVVQGVERYISGDLMKALDHIATVGAISFSISPDPSRYCSNDLQRLLIGHLAVLKHGHGCDLSDFLKSAAALGGLGR